MKSTGAIIVWAALVPLVAITPGFGCGGPEPSDAVGQANQADTGAVVKLRKFSWTVRTKQYLGKVGANTGLPPWGAITNAQKAAFLALAKATDATFNENPTFDAGAYRLMTDLHVEIGCHPGDDQHPEMEEEDVDDAVGTDPAPGVGGIPAQLWRLPADVEWAGHENKDNDKRGIGPITITWGAKAAPALFTEPAFAFVTPRTNRQIWHVMKLVIQCEGGVGKAKLSIVSKSPMPSLRSWEQGAQLLLPFDIAQGSFSQLWNLGAPPAGNWAAE